MNNLPSSCLCNGVFLKNKVLFYFDYDESNYNLDFEKDKINLYPIRIGMVPS